MQRLQQSKETLNVGNVLSQHMAQSKAAKPSIFESGDQTKISGTMSLILFPFGNQIQFSRRILTF